PIARPFAFAAHALPMNRVRRAHGLPSLGWDVRRIYCDGDLTLYADIPELIPIFGAPPNNRYIGPVLWSPPVDPPSWWSEATGGSSTTAQALLRGIPVVGIAHNLDQYLNVHYIERFGAGTLLRADRTRADAVRNATRRAMEDPHMRERAGAIASLAAGIQSD